MILPHILYWLGALADGYTTKRAVLDHGAEELNPIGKFFLRYKVPGIVVLKLLGWLLFLWLGAPALWYYIAFAAQMVVAASNHFGWL